MNVATRRAGLAPLCERETAAAIADRLRPFCQRGVLESVDIHVVDELGALLREGDPDVLLGLALAARAPRHGHICVDLSSLRIEQLLPEQDEDPAGAEQLQLPVDRAAWLARIERSTIPSKCIIQGHNL